MKLQFALLLLIIFASKDSFSQYEIEEIGEPALRQSGVLGSRQIQIINNTQNSITLRCSADKRSWGQTKVSINSGIDVHLQGSYAYFFVQTCRKGESATECMTYKLQPKNRYVIKWAEEEKEYVIKKITGSKNP